MNIRPALPADAAAIARVHVESWRTSYRGIVPDEVLEGLSVERRIQQWAEAITQPAWRHTLILVAEESPLGDQPGKIVGFASSGAERESDPVYRGELYAIYLLESAQRRGVGRALVAASAGHLVDSGLNSMLVWVFRDNPARRFYERLGGKYIREKLLTIGGVDLVEAAYGWRDLTALAGSSLTDK